MLRFHTDDTWFRSCCDPVAVEIDPDCKFYGGRIHAATITPKDGFQWVPGYEPALPKNI
jgi:hypothetical protein